MNAETIQNKIYEVRNQKVMLDFDLAALYDTQTKRLKEAVRRNLNRFPADFMFELTAEEFAALRTQIAALEKGRGQHTKFLPFAFTEQGVAMLSSVLHSPKAIGVNISIVRAFVFMRQYALSHADLTGKLKELEITYNKKFNDIHEAISFLLRKESLLQAQQDRKPIGFDKSKENGPASAIKKIAR
jgi:hypothetical protein